MKTIYKYELPPLTSVVEMPIGAKILTAASQGEEVCIWAEVETENDLEERLFSVVATGSMIPTCSAKFIQTVFIDWMVFHVYELPD